MVFRPTGLKRVLFFVMNDAILSIFSIYFAFLLRFNFDIPNSFGDAILNSILIILPLKIGILS